MRAIPISHKRSRGCRCIALGARGLMWLAALSVISCGSDDSTAPAFDASTRDDSAIDVATSLSDGSVGKSDGDEHAEVSKDSGAADGPADGAAVDAGVADVQTTDEAADADGGNECCVKPPSIADNPPIPAGYRLLAQSEVTPEMTSWAVMILDDPATYPMFDTATKTFGNVTVLLRVEWHAPDFQNMAVHRGVTLYVPI